MHTSQVQLAVIACAALAGQAYAFGFDSKHLSFRHAGLSGLARVRRQAGASDDTSATAAGEEVDAVEDFPEACAQQCSPYLEVGNTCATNANNASNGGLSGTEAQQEALKCACSVDFFQSLLTCISCAPGTFTDSAGYTPKDLVTAALGQCKAATGEDLTNKLDLSGLDGGASSADLSSTTSPGSDDEAAATASSTGPDAAADSTTDKASEASSTASSKANASSSSSASPSSASSTGAASTSSTAQQALALLFTSLAGVSYLFLA